MFTVASFTIAKTCKQPECLSTDEWMKMWHIYAVLKISTIMSIENIILCVNTAGRKDGIIIRFHQSRV